ncbi:MAG: hypothetical protein V4487_04145 [Chlamydiota bacterium]
MKIALFLGVAGMMLPMVSHGQSVDKSEPQKVYIKPAQLLFEDREIFVYVEEQWVLVNAVHSDALGLFVTPLIANYPWTRWLCPECGYNNNGADKTCQKEDYGKKCGFPRPN